MTTARLESERTHIVPGRLKVTELVFEVPTDYSNPSLGSLKIFARSVIRHENSVHVMDEEVRKQAQKPWLVFLQGGPGFPCSAPQDMPITDFILDKNYQILYLDQRGTGLSTPISAATLAMQGDTHQQADYLKLFRADSIVKDCEAIRKVLTKGCQFQKWSVLGQSFGGFCVLTYLSQHPEGLREAFTLGGLPPIGKSAEQVYKATYQKVIQRNKEYYKKFPEDVDTVHCLAMYINSQSGISLPSGGILTVRGFLTLGRGFGMHGGLDSVHDLVYRMQSDIAQFDFITRPTLSAIETALSFDNAVLYAVLHEPIYCQRAASNWAADSVGKSLKEFHWLHDSPLPQFASVDREPPLYFSGEMVFPFQFEIFPELQKLASVADILAKYSGWSKLYDEEQLAHNDVPLYAATFVDDMYVDFGLAQDTAKLVKGCKQLITNTLYHNAIRSQTKVVMESLFALRE